MIPAMRYIGFLLNGIGKTSMRDMRDNQRAYKQMVGRQTLSPSPARPAYVR